MNKDIGFEDILPKRAKNYNGKVEKEKTELLEMLRKSIAKKAILGFDIYKYSKYNKVEQILIPELFKVLYETTIRNCISNEGFFFKGFSKKDDFTHNFIDTGDGGFQILDNPFQSIIFAIYFQANVKRYNSFGSDKYLRDIIGEITLRFALTYDDIYYSRSNFYGTAIINNSRIMSKDALNRFLIDSNVNDWFDKELNCFENISIITKKDIIDNKIMSGYVDLKGESYLFDNNNMQISNISKIGEISSKSDLLSIFNIFLQIKMRSSNPSKTFKRYVISLGNLNTGGIS